MVTVKRLARVKWWKAKAQNLGVATWNVRSLVESVVVVLVWWRIERLIVLSTSCVVTTSTLLDCKRLAGHGLGARRIVWRIGSFYFRSLYLLTARFVVGANELRWC